MGLLYFISNPAKSCLLLLVRATDKRCQFCQWQGRRRLELVHSRSLEAAGYSSNGQFSQFSQVLDASNLPDIWIQFLQRKNLRHFNPFGGLKSRRKRKHPLHSEHIHFHCCRVCFAKSYLLRTEIHLKTHFTAILNALYIA